MGNCTALHLIAHLIPVPCPPAATVPPRLKPGQRLCQLWRERERECERETRRREREGERGRREKEGERGREKEERERRRREKEGGRTEREEEKKQRERP